MIHHACSIAEKYGTFLAQVTRTHYQAFLPVHTVNHRKMSGHGHSHGEGHSHSHEDLEGAERGNLYSLYLKIDTERVECLNEERNGSGKDVFKPWDQRLDTEKVLSRIIAQDVVCIAFTVRFCCSWQNNSKFL